MRRSRKVVSVFVVAVLVLALLSSSALAAPPSWANNSKAKGNVKVRFMDVDEGFSWASKSISRMNLKGIIQGVGNNLFQPNRSVTHLEAVIMTLRLLDKEDDVSRVSAIPELIRKVPLLWLYGFNYITIAVDQGIVTPEELSSFNPNKPAKRWEVAKYIVRAIDEDEDWSRTEIADMKDELKDRFKDANSIPNEAVGYVYKALDLEIMNGYANGNFMPNKPVTRVEMAVLIDRADNLDLDDDDDDEENKEIIGVVNDIDEDDMEIKIDGKWYDVSDDVEVYDEDEDEIDFDELGEGDTVRLLFDKNGDVVFIEILEEVVVRGTIKRFSDTRIEITLRDNKTMILYFADDVKVYIKSSKEDVDDLTVGDYGRFKYLGNELLEVRITERAKTEKLEDQGKIARIDYKSFRIKLDNGNTYRIDEDVDVEIDGDDAGFEDLKVGYDVKIKGEDNVVTKIEAETEDADDFEFEVKGFVTAIDKVGTLWISIAGKSYKVDSDVNVKINGRTKSYADLQKGYYAWIQGEDDIVTKIEATTPENLTLEFEGEIKSITRTNGVIYMTIEDASGFEYTYEVSGDVEIDGDADEINDLRRGSYWAELEVEKGKIVKIDAEEIDD